MKNCAQFIADHNADVDRLFTDRWSFEQAEVSYQEFDKQTGGKGAFVF